MWTWFRLTRHLEHKTLIRLRESKQHLVDDCHVEEVELPLQLSHLDLKELFYQSNLPPHHFPFCHKTSLGQTSSIAIRTPGSPPRAVLFDPVLNALPAETVLALGRGRVHPKVQANCAGEGFLQLHMPPRSFLHFLWIVFGHYDALQFIRD